MGDTHKAANQQRTSIRRCSVAALACVFFLASPPAFSQSDNVSSQIINEAVTEENWPAAAVELVEDILSRSFMPGDYYDFEALKETLPEQELLERHMEYVFHDSIMGIADYPRVVEEMDAFLEETGLEVTPAFRTLSSIGYETMVSNDYRTGLDRVDAFLRARGFTADEYVRALVLQAVFLLYLDQDIDAANVVRDITAFTNRHSVSEFVAFDVAQLEIRVFEAHTSPQSMIDLLSREYWTIQDLMLPYTVSSTPHDIATMLYTHGRTAELQQVTNAFLTATESGEYAYLRGDALHSCAMLNLAQGLNERAIECAVEAEPYVTNQDNIRYQWAVTTVEAAIRAGDADLAQTYFEKLSALPEAQLNNRNQFTVAELDARLLTLSGDIDAAYNAMLTFHQTKAVALDDEIQALAANQMQYLQEEADRITERANLLNLQNTLQQRTIRLFQWLSALFGLLLALSIAFAFLMLRKNREVVHARDDARRMSEVKSRFLANMSHEVRTPMNGVIGLAGALEKTELNTRQSELVTLIQRSSKLMTNVLDDILDLSRIESEKIIIENKAFVPRELFEETRVFFEASTDREGLSLTFVPNISENLLVNGDASRIRQILYNLITNALKFTDSGSIEVRCWVNKTGRTDNKICLWFSVEDTGQGIPSDKLKTIFEPFMQADSSSTRRFGGLGLGLAISRQLVELMDGSIHASSTIGSGTQIDFCVPVELISEDVAIVSEIETPVSIETTTQVLVAEDHPMNRKVIDVLMDGLGISPRIVETGLDAVSAYQQAPFGFVFLDIQMPVMDGIDALIRMKEIDLAEGRTPPQYIAFTANAMTHQVEHYKAAGFDHVLTKPVEMQSLITIFSSTPTVEAETEDA